VAAGIIFVAGVFAIEILETHKTAGVVLKVTRGLRDLESGQWDTRVVLRKHDNFKELEEAFNAAGSALRTQVQDDADCLQEVENQLGLVGREFEAGNHEGALLLLRQVSAEIRNLRERRCSLLRSADHEQRSAAKI
jgi:signal transduction histidine kinase